MKLKQVPEDFIVNEIYDLESFSQKKEEKDRDYYYFKLTKRNYAQFSALDKVSNIFGVSRKWVNFAGTKDKLGVTSQIISIFGLKEFNLEKNVDFFNSKIDDINIEFIGKYKGRINLGDNLGNAFEIVVRDLTKDDILVAKKNLDEIGKFGVWNYFDEQRFGYAQNSHIVGRYLLLDEVEMALKTLLCSCPKDASIDLKKYTDFIFKNWGRIVKQDEKVLDEIKKIIPKFLSSDLHVIRHLLRAKNDFFGAFRNIPKKIRTLYVNAYQSYVFNEMLADFSKAESKDVENIPEDLELVNSQFNFDDFGGSVVKRILDEDGLTLENFKLPRMPELKLGGIIRKVRIQVQDLKFDSNLEDLDGFRDDMNEGKYKLKVSFALGPGEYATNVVKQLFGQKDNIIK
ncbi:MAG: tRNA pseudouridine(13) synthase TruD [Nanoarchaeota archaeon]|nr:tRNA pseudouridine(13) synthase TruD [Nanoarchaeota archaeon]